jgi:transcriptional regulator with XRE-family HTH domain
MVTSMYDIALAAQYPSIQLRRTAAREDHTPLTGDWFDHSMDTLTTSRLVLARKRRRLSLVKLHEATGISVRSLSAYENGHQQPSDENLRLLSRALGFPAAFFYGAEIDEIPIAAISFRALTKTPAYQRDAARSAGRLALLLMTGSTSASASPILTCRICPTLILRLRRRWCGRAGVSGRRLFPT